MQNKKFNLYLLYYHDRHGHTRFAGRFASFAKLKAAASFLTDWFFEVDSKEDEYAWFR